MHKIHSDPEFRKTMCEAAQKRSKNSEWKNNVSDANRRKANDPEFQRKMANVRLKQVENSTIKVFIANDLINCGIKPIQALKLAEIGETSFHKYRKYISPE